MGIDVKKILIGAKKALDDFYNQKEKYTAYQSAKEIFENFPQRNIFEHWFFVKKFENLGKWYRQLLAESIGKVRENDSVGITPVIAIGTIDLHSVAQLSPAHPNDRSIAIVYEETHDAIELETSPFLSILSHLEGKKFDEIMDAARLGFTDAIRTKNMPLYSYSIDTKNPETLGYWMQLKMIEIALMAEFFGINAFNQPNVEEYKS